ncbi:SDR family oxidoreductase [Sungkyunkwania multivorans]|uniref:SDR family oxidoreductase n=1 Tax=Sungkyunkwania multivorans TaxID=1173618 RepID=A0ABW3CZ28_9FLAO
MQHLLILGAKSDIAMAIAKKYAANGYHLLLAGRNIDDLDTFKEDLKVTYKISVSLLEFDVLKETTHTSFFKALPIQPAGVICCIGYLGDEALAQTSFEEVDRIIRTNFLGCVSILNVSAEYLEKQGEGFIVGISSVAGERGRASNYHYGSAKAGFTAYLSGLNARLSKKGIHVLIVKPGFVDTKMTAHLSLPKRLTTTPDVVAKKIFSAQRRKRNVIYVKAIWRPIMFVIRILPAFIFKRLNL